MTVLTDCAETTDQETGMQAVALLQIREVGSPSRRQTGNAYPLLHPPTDEQQGHICIMIQRAIISDDEIDYGQSPSTSDDTYTSRTHDMFS